jgi:transcriptional regulator with XRE-family HTH domain
MGMKTYPRVTALLDEKRKEHSVNWIVGKTGLNFNTIAAYIDGRSEPSTESLEKIARAFGKTVAWLRGDSEKVPANENIVDLSDLSTAKRQLWDRLVKSPDAKVQAILELLK